MARMHNGWRYGVGALAALVLVACRSGSREEAQQEATSVAEQAQEEAQAALDRARQLQEEATGQQREAARAEQQVQQEREELAEAQQQAQAEGQEAQQAQQRAQQEVQQAQAAARAQQDQALQAQRQTGQQAQADQPGAARERTITGELVELSEEEIRVGPERGNEVRLRIDAQTLVLQGGRQTSIQQLQPGTQVRATYELRQGEPVVTHLEALGPSGAQQPGAQQQPSGAQQQPGAAQQPSPSPGASP